MRKFILSIPALLIFITFAYSQESNCKGGKLSKEFLSCKAKNLKSAIIKDLGEHPEDKKPVRIMKGQYGPYIKYKSLNATIPEEKDPTELNMEEALILIEKRREYDKNKKTKKKKKK